MQEKDNKKIPSSNKIFSFSTHSNQIDNFFLDMYSKKKSHSYSYKLLFVKHR